jgi:hypothetical protein
MATKLHFFATFVQVPQATPQVLGQLTTESLRHADLTRGALRGLQSGLGVLPILVSENVCPEACAMAQRRPQTEFGALLLPAVVDAASGRTYSYTGRMLWGAVYLGWMRAQLARITAVPTPAESSSGR